ncbi:MAG: lytic murein transglycosylase B [Ectothiorhodospiraceae bacterium]|nr:lytic murein transglycosylase B [Ectothiorhodospiraceae bacterium]
MTHRPTLKAILAGLALSVASLGTVNAEPLDQNQPEIQAFIDTMVQEHGLEREAVSALLSEARHQQSIIDAITRPAEAMPWKRYRPIFLGEDRIDEGVEFWNEHAELIGRIAEEYDVSPAIIVAIIGVETRYGQHRGRHRVLDALATLAFGYPPRSDFFRRELAQFMLLTEEEQLDPLEIRGSYAGAMGVPQFISSSYRHYAADGDGDGRRDLMNNTADAVASVANYFRQHRWREGEPVVRDAALNANADVSGLVNRGRQPYTTVGELRAAGVDTDLALDDDLPATLMELEGPDGKEYWVGLHNFYVITRYNHSPLYALAVYQLSEAIRERREDGE